MKKLYFIIAMLMGAHAYCNPTISIIAPASVTGNTISNTAIADVQQLLQQACGCNVSLNKTDADIKLVLPEIDKTTAEQASHFAVQATFPYRNFPEHNYTWQIKAEGNSITYTLTTSSWQGVSFGLYGLLQEHLGFKFYHPKQTIIPHFENGWPAEHDKSFSATALFDKKGFHIHSQHPLELTEQLLDPTYPNALNDVKQYIDWLVRNGQNYFEFCLLNDVDRKLWPAHAKAMVDYAHSRGILASIDLSLHLIQQKSFQLYAGPFNKQKQVEKSLQWLAQADWDFYDMEFSTSEFIAGNKKKKEELRQFIITWLQKHSHTKLTGRQHIVKNENELGDKKKGFVWDSKSLALDKKRGVLAHTVMFYSMTEPNAPVYENKNQRHQLEFMLSQLKQRETWYFPESAYWITFDNSLPLFLLPYLNARLSDIDTCVKYAVPGHITFSSGWEWGYWLFDWSIARWSWQYSYNGQREKRYPAMYAYQVSNAANAKVIEQALHLQQQYLKDSTLMQWMTAMTFTDEVGIKALAKEYEPRPKWSYKYLARKAPIQVIQQVRNTILPQLANFSKASLELLGGPAKDADSINNEWRDGISITAYRAMHRYYTLQYILNRREAAINKMHFNDDRTLVKAVAVRKLAQQLVEQREQHYRYALSSIAAKRWDHTAYHFGYLYLAHNLHLWRREECQAYKNNYSPFYLNVWNLGRIAGIIK